MHRSFLDFSLSVQFQFDSERQPEVKVQPPAPLSSEKKASYVPINPRIVVHIIYTQVGRQL